TPLDQLRAFAARFGPPRSYRLTRGLLLRLLGVVYLAAFLGLTRQVLPLIGSHGLTPVTQVLDELRARGDGFSDVPTLFWIDCSDTTLVVFAWIGLVLSLVAVA